ncbi:MAG: hypothetical protein HQ445_07885 [Polaromonas sp.]|nr:hypothetical protein [Polaromonas sp.]
MQALSISESSRPTALTLAPMSAAVAAIWHQLQAEMLKENHGLATVPAGAIVLASPTTDCPARFHHGNDYTMLTVGSCGNEDTYIKRHSRPASWSATMWHPAHWRHSMYRLDAQGRPWSAYGEPHVIDDFGSLVPVAA